MISTPSLAYPTGDSPGDPPGDPPRDPPGFPRKIPFVFPGSSPKDPLVCPGAVGSGGSGLEADCLMLPQSQTSPHCISLTDSVSHLKRHRISIPHLPHSSLLPPTSPRTKSRKCPLCYKVICSVCCPCCLHVLSRVPVCGAVVACMF